MVVDKGRQAKADEPGIRSYARISVAALHFSHIALYPKVGTTGGGTTLKPLRTFPQFPPEAP